MSRRTHALGVVAIGCACAALAGALGLFTAPEAAAWSATPRYAQDAIAGGGGGRFFTGSPVDGYTCEVCHDGGSAVEIEVSGLPRDGWQPGATYDLELRWETTEVLTLVAELMADDGTQSGSIALPANPPAEATCDSGVPAVELIDREPGRRIAALADCGASSVVLEWTAPDEVEACNADAVLYVAGVHGDATESPDGDGVTTLRRRIPPADGDPCDAAASGCALSRRRGALAPCIAALVFVSRRRRSRP
jgi:hypothetical protein